MCAGRYVLLDVIFNHTGDNFFYKHEGKMVSTLPYKDHKSPFGAWKDGHGKRNPPPLLFFHPHLRSHAHLAVLRSVCRACSV